MSTRSQLVFLVLFPLAAALQLASIASAEPPQERARVRARSGAAQLHPGARAVIRSVGAAQVRAPRGEVARQRAQLARELHQTQKLLRSTLRAMEAGSGEEALPLVAAQRERLSMMVDEIRTPRRVRSDVQRVEEKLAELSTEVDALLALPDGPARRARARALLERVEGPLESGSGRRPATISYPFSAKKGAFMIHEDAARRVGQ